ncbi:capsule assembly Wzi family protein [Christiangramia aquimixticola]|uniref:capsule assembly Wzi family protein n=1 Tax=Christiangramia aquimixticola TaxID=1697558 RepID=UPI003AA89C2D
MKPKILIFLSLLLGNVSYGQFETKLDITALGNIYTGEESPFWIHTNHRGRVDEETFYSGLISSEIKFEVSETESIDFGVGAFYKDGYDDGLKIDEAYFSYISKNFGVVLGKKQRADIFQSLSASNENILWSLNSGPLPGVRIFTRSPIFLNGSHGLGIKLKLEEYLMDDERYVMEIRLHHKSAHLVFRNQNNLEISMGLHQFVQWAGTSPEYGKLPSSFKDYTRVFTGMPGAEDVGGQEVNALGNQLGSYEISVKTKINNIDFHFLYNHIFEDASGLKMGNLPDGRYVIYFEDNRDTFWGTDWVKAFIYEFYYTKNQSRSRKSSEVDGADNYFNNNLYRSGWTYQNSVIGTPFILKNINRFRIGMNILTVHHLGVKGTAFDKLPYRFLLSYRKNYGLKDSFYPETRHIFSTLIEVELINADYNLDVMLGTDVKSYDSSNIGIGIKWSKNIF